MGHHNEGPGIGMRIILKQQSATWDEPETFSLIAILQQQARQAVVISQLKQQQARAKQSRGCKFTLNMLGNTKEDHKLTMVHRAATQLLGSEHSNVLVSISQPCIQIAPVLLGWVWATLLVSWQKRAKLSAGQIP